MGLRAVVLLAIALLVVAGCFDRARPADEDGQERRSTAAVGASVCGDNRAFGEIRIQRSGGDAGYRHGARSPVVWFYGTGGSAITFDLPCSFVEANFTISWNVTTSFPDEAVIVFMECGAPAGRGSAPVQVRFDATQAQPGSTCLVEPEGPPSGPAGAWSYEAITWKAAVTFREVTADAA